MNKNINTFTIVTLGCVKNEVDSEMLLGYFTDAGLKCITDIKQADLVILNTCGFIVPAKREAIKKIFELLEYKKSGNMKLFFVVGCLAKRYKKELEHEIPEIDLVMGVDEYDNIKQIVSKYIPSCRGSLSFNNRVISTTFPSAYIRICDGCNNKCNYCTIPSIRGNMKSRTMEDILDEVKSLACLGYSEFNVIAQDTTNYGIDIYNELSLAKLLTNMSKIDGVRWIRVLYMYPGKITDELIDVIADNEKMCKYFDIPIQHISDKMLIAMNRHTNKNEIFELIKKIKERIPLATIRTTIMVGHPKETQIEQAELIESLKQLKFDKLGAFIYSKEEVTVSYNMEQIPSKIKKERYVQVMETQQKLVDDKLKKLIGQTYEVLVESVSKNEKSFVARTRMDAPDVDNKVYIKITRDNIDRVVLGGYINVLITNSKGYDLIAEVV